MKNSFPAKLIPLLALALLGLTGCAPSKSTGFQGYLEGEFIYVASPLAGRLETLAVQKGARVAAGAPLFTLERSAELATQRQAADQLRAAQARLEDLKKGSRPSELAALEARRAQAATAADLSAREFARQQNLFETKVISANDFDRARLVHEQDQHVVDALTAQVATANLGARSDAIAAAAAEVSAAAAAKDRADWNVNQKTQAAPKAALVYDTLYREGEFIAAGLPAVALLPPENLKVRFFVPEPEFAALKAGAAVHVAITGLPAPLAAHISYLSPQPEFTPPILYNRENRAKLVFMVEAVFDGDTRDLHPGQPADVTLAH
ncbi:MAG: HlyD family efflux transporter periplasmic adaptor subunit [Opitutaceae bacterium]